MKIIKIEAGLYRVGNYEVRDLKEERDDLGYDRSNTECRWRVTNTKIEEETGDGWCTDEWTLRQAKEWIKEYGQK